MKNLLLAIVSVFGLTCLTASADSAPATPVSSTPPPAPPPSACFSDYLESKSDFYVEVNGGAIFFDGPIKDQSNIYRGNGALGGNPVTNPIDPNSTSDTTGSIGGTFGYVLDRNPQENWLGHNLRAETSADYFQTSASESSTTIPGTNFFGMGRVDGQNFGIINPVFYGTNPVNVSFDSHDEMYDADLVVKSDYGLAKGAFVLTPELGLGFGRLEQRSSTNITGFSSNNPGYANEQESITTDYYGAILGFELKANVSKQFVPFLCAITTLGYAQSNYFGAQEFNALFSVSSENGNDSTSDSDGNFFAREQINGGFYYDFGPVILKVSGGVDYWSNVATVQEATVPSGAALAQNPNVGPSHLKTTSMANPEANVTVVVPF